MMKIPHDNANIQFAVEYDFDGKKWALDIWASTREEAEMKLKAVAKGRILGVTHAQFEAGPNRCPTCGRGDNWSEYE